MSENQPKAKRARTSTKKQRVNINTLTELVNLVRRSDGRWKFLKEENEKAYEQIERKVNNYHQRLSEYNRVKDSIEILPISENAQTMINTTFLKMKNNNAAKNYTRTRLNNAIKKYQFNNPHVTQINMNNIHIIVARYL
jgi:hypothetical protein